MTNGVDYWRGLYDFFWCCASGDRLVRGHVGLCYRGGDLGPYWYIPAVVNAAIPPGKQSAVSLNGWVFRKWTDSPNGDVAVSLDEAKAACQRGLGRAQGLPMAIRPGF